MTRQLPLEIPINLVTDDSSKDSLVLEIEIGGQIHRVDLSKHLQGQHDQSEHGRPGRGGQKPTSSAGKPSAQQEQKPTQKPTAQPPEESAGKVSSGQEASGPPSSRGVFDVQEWGAKNVMERKKEFLDLPVRVRNQLANAKETVPAREKGLLSEMPERPATENLKADLKTRVEHFTDRVHPEGLAKIQTTVDDLDNNLSSMGVSDEDRREITMGALETLSAQEMETCTRQLGDHGIAHIKGNIDVASEIMKSISGSNTPEDKLVMQLSMIYHDTGYLTPTSQMFLDHGHGKWSQQHFDKNVRPALTKALGDDLCGEISNIIATHDHKTLDWESDPVGSACRVGDIMALFQKEKLPAILRYAPGNTDLLKSFAAKEISLKECQDGMRKNIDSTSLPEKVKFLLHNGVNEVSDFTPKMALGMLGGELGKMKYNGEFVDISLKENKDMTALNKCGDFHQAQFAKVCKEFGVDVEKFKTDLSFEFKDKSGHTLLRCKWDKEKGFTIEIVKQ
jgi:hypothetical protein